MRVPYSAVAASFVFALSPLASVPAHADDASGVVDPAFTPPDIGAGGLDDDFNPAGTVQSSVVQADGKLLVAGSQIRGIVRLNADGSKDTTFDVGAGTDGTISALIQQPDGSVLIGGEFTTINGVSAPRLARLLPNGTIDTNFKPRVDAPVRAIAMLSTGQVAVGGEFTTVNSASAKSLARLNADGTTDASFQSNLGADGTVYAIAERPDGTGRLLVGGAFNNLGGAARANLGQVMANGTADGGFDPGDLPALANTATTRTLTRTAAKGADGTVRVIRFLDDGSGTAVVGGSFAHVGSVAQQALVQVNATGAVDPGFVPGGAAGASVARASGGLIKNGITGSAATVYSVDVQKDGKLVVGGAFSKIADLLRNALARLNKDGSVDTKYNSGSGANASVRTVKLQGDGKTVVAGSFSKINNVARGGVARLTADNGTAAFFKGQVALSGGFYYLQFPNGKPFGYFNLAGNGYSFPYFYHNDLGLEYFFDANDGKGGAYFYDFASNGFFYTSPQFPFPYLYDFSLNSVVYYYPDPNNPGHYNTNGFRFFYVFNTQQIIVK